MFTDVGACRTLMRAIKWIASVACLLFFSVPIAIKIYPWLVVHIVFVHMVRWPPFIDFDKPKDFGLNQTRNFRIVHDNISLGLWHTLPSNLGHTREYRDGDYESSLSRGHTTIIYYHGNTGTRAGRHRVELYKKLSLLGYHVIAVDYRGYGDSTGSPTELGVTRDARAVYNWVKSHADRSPIFLWGHSLGTGITMKLAKQLAEEGKSPVGIVLESPFNNLREAASRHPFTLPYRFLPWFSSIFLDTLTHQNCSFQSDENVAMVKAPLLILHAKDDSIVPYELGHKLYTEAVRRRPGADPHITSFVAFEASHRYGHKHIYRAPELPAIVQKFVADSLSWQSNHRIQHDSSL